MVQDSDLRFFPSPFQPARLFYWMREIYTVREEKMFFNIPEYVTVLLKSADASFLLFSDRLLTQKENAY